MITKFRWMVFDVDRTKQRRSESVNGGALIASPHRMTESLLIFKLAPTGVPGKTGFVFSGIGCRWADKAVLQPPEPVGHFVQSVFRGSVFIGTIGAFDKP